MNRAPEHKVYEFDDFRIDADHRMLYRDGDEISMSPKAVETLLALIERRGEIVSKEELLEAVWPDVVVEESNLFFYLSLLRKNLGTLKDGTPYVQTLRRRGYRFNGQVRLVSKEIEYERDVTAVGKSDRSEATAQPGQIYFVKDWDRKKESREPGYATSAAPALKPVQSSNDLMTAANESGSAEVSPTTEVSAEPLQNAKVANSDLPSKAEQFKRTKASYLLAASLAAILISLAFVGSVYWRSRRAIPKNASIRTIAILPFRPLSKENRDEILELGMADTLITRLSTNKTLEVRPFISVRRFSGPDRDAINAGKLLNVEAVLDP